MTTPPHRPTFLQATTIAGSGFLIAFFGCLGALSGFNNGFSTTLGEVGIAGFVIGGLVFVIGGFMLLVVIIRPFFTKRPTGPDETPAASSAPPPARPQPTGPPEET